MRICKHTFSGRRQIIDFVFPGEYISLVQLGEHIYSAEAISDVEALSYPQDSLRRISDADPSTARHVRELLSHDLVGLNRHITILGRHTAKGRVASFVLMLAERQHPAIAGCVDIVMSRQEIADYLGLTIETICRTLKALKGVGAIEFATVHRIRLHDPALLHAIADGTDPEANLRIEETAQSMFEYTENRFTATKCNELRTTEA